jgi:hypothetical protein
MSNRKMDEAVDQCERSCSVLKSIDSFNDIEVIGVVHGVLTPTLEEECVIAIYDRATNNVKSLLELKQVRHFQAIGMLARALFELTVESKLMDVVPKAALKMLHFRDVEKLKVCQNSVRFASTNALTHLRDTTVQQEFISNHRQRIESLAASFWPNTKLKKLTHWSEMNLAKRVDSLADPKFQEMYALFYRQLSWNVHPGLQGATGLKSETFAHLCARSLYFAATLYEMLIRDVVRIFQLSIHDPSIQNKMTFARLVPFTDDGSDEAALRRDLNL